MEKVKIQKVKMQKSKADIILDIAVYIVIAVVLVVTLYPILNTLAVSFNEGIDSVRGGIHIWPRAFTLNNYKSVFSNGNLIRF